MFQLNRVELMGFVGRDPEVRHTASGDPVVSLNLATSENWTDKRTGEKRERTEWHRIVIWQPKVGELVQKSVRRGSFLYVCGNLRTRKWSDQAGNDRWATEIVLSGYDARVGFLDRRNIEGASRPDGEGPTPPADLDDEIPF